MNLKNVIITHEGYPIPVSKCSVNAFGATSAGMLRTIVICYDSQFRVVGRKLIEYNMSNMLEGIVYRHSNHTHEQLIERAWLEGDTLHIDIHDENHDAAEYSITELTKEFKYVQYEGSDPTIPEELDHTAVFPPPETHKEWVDRMERLICRSAHNLENALGQIHPRQYTRLRDFVTAPVSSNNLDRLVNTSIHCRWQIGWLWARVNRLKRGLTSTYTKATLEPMIQALYSNMKEVENIKQFFHKHDIVEWKKLRNDSGDDRNNKRKIQLWADDYTPGTELADLNARATIADIFYETTAKASEVEFAMTEYKKAAIHSKWDIITERVY